MVERKRLSNFSVCPRLVLVVSVVVVVDAKPLRREMHIAGTGRGLCCSSTADTLDRSAGIWERSDEDGLVCIVSVFVCSYTLFLNDVFSLVERVYICVSYKNCVF